MPKLEDATCTKLSNCVQGCCQARMTKEGQKSQPTLCGDGCCDFSSAGTREACGRRLRNSKKVKEGEECCISESASPLDQQEDNCCIHGTGKDCNAEIKGHFGVSCCLDPAPTYDQHGWRQPAEANCSKPQPESLEFGIEFLLELESFAICECPGFTIARNEDMTAGVGQVYLQVGVESSAVCIVASRPFIMHFERRRTAFAKKCSQV